MNVLVDLGRSQGCGSHQPPPVLAHIASVGATVSVWTWRQMGVLSNNLSNVTFWRLPEAGYVCLNYVDRYPWSCELWALMTAGFYQHRCFAVLLNELQLDPDKHLSEVSRNSSPEAHVSGAQGNRFLFSISHIRSDILINILHISEAKKYIKLTSVVWLWIVQRNMVCWCTFTCFSF